MVDSIYDLFEEFDTGIIVVSDFDIITSGVRVDCITYHVNYDQIGIWAGDPIYDKYAEELISLLLLKSLKSLKQNLIGQKSLELAILNLLRRLLTNTEIDGTGWHCLKILHSDHLV